MSESAKVVVLGTDHPHVFGLANTAKQLSGAELAGVYAADAAQRDEAAERMEVPAFDSVDEALAVKPALVLIGAVPAKRAELAQQALEAGAGALIDKPLALTQSALEALKAAQQRSGRQVIVYYPYRGHPLVRAAKQLLDEGRIGKLVRVFAAGPHKLNAPNRPDWHWTRNGNGGALIDIGSHHVDFCCWIAGETPTWLCATHGNLSQPDHPEFQDFAQAQLRFGSGAFGHVEVDWLNPASMKHFGDTRFWLQGTAGKIELRLGDEQSAYLWTDEVAGEPIAPAAADDAWDQRLMEALITNQPCAIPQEDVWRTSEITLRAFESAERGGEPVALQATV
ncbi:MAG: Gfo/Idh/MocA family protein [Phycisphaeraceae bacterium]